MLGQASPVAHLKRKNNMFEYRYMYLLHNCILYPLLEIFNDINHTNFYMEFHVELEIEFKNYLSKYMKISVRNIRPLND